MQKESLIGKMTKGEISEKPDGKGIEQSRPIHRFGKSFLQIHTRVGKDIDIGLPKRGQCDGRGISKICSRVDIGKFFDQDNQKTALEASFNTSVICNYKYISD